MDNGRYSDYSDAKKYSEKEDDGDDSAYNYDQDRSPKKSKSKKSTNKSKSPSKFRGYTESESNCSPAKMHSQQQIQLNQLKRESEGFALVSEDITNHNLKQMASKLSMKVVIPNGQMSMNITKADALSKDSEETNVI
jgi:hypothetical protein